MEEIKLIVTRQALADMAWYLSMFCFGMAGVEFIKSSWSEICDQWHRWRAPDIAARTRRVIRIDHRGRQ